MGNSKGTEIKSGVMSNALLANVTGLGVTSRGIVSNVYRGGQLGTGIDFTTLDAATAIAFNPAQIVVLQCPAMYDTVPEVQQALKAIIETYPKSVTGLAFSYNLATEEHVAGMDGQMVKIPTRTTRSAVSPSFTWNELTGGIIWNLMRRWMFDIQHPDTNISNLAAEFDADAIPQWVMSTYSMSMLAIQYDATGLPDRIIDAALYTNMFPTDIGELPIQRVINTHEIQERTIQFTGIVQHNDNIKELAYQTALMMNAQKLNYNYALPGLIGSTDPSYAINEQIAKYGLYDEIYGGGYNTETDTSAGGNPGKSGLYVPVINDEDATSAYTGDNQILQD